MVPALPARVAEELAAVARDLRARLGDRVADVRLYGSYARGEQHDESDIDVLVVLRPMVASDWGAVGDAFDAAKRRSHLPLSWYPIDHDHLEFLRGRERRFALEVDRDGVSL